MKKNMQRPLQDLENVDGSAFFTKKRLTSLTLVWGFSLVWICLVEFPFFSPIKDRITDRTIDRVAGLIEDFKKDQKQVPDSLATLRQFAMKRGQEFGFYDAFGNRLSYTRLGKKHYLIRSFGADEVQNHANSSPDRVRIHGGAFPKGAALAYEARPDIKPALYPAILLEGSDSADGGWHARLYHDRHTRLKHLIIRKKEPSGLVMVAPHDRIEEFFWVPGRLQLVYSVTGSKRSPDGVYLWDLTTDQVADILSRKNASGRGGPMESMSKISRLWLSLAGISEKGPTVYGFAAPRHDGGLDVRDFFRPERFFIVKIPDRPLEDASFGKTLAKTQVFRPDLFKGLDGLLSDGYLSRDRLRGLPYSKAQRRFLVLPLRGEPEPVLLKWNHYADRVIESPIFPYALWVLASLYSEAYENLLPQASKEADVLRSYGTEIANALLNDPLAPSYLKALAFDAHQRLLTGSPLPYRLGDLSKPVPERPQ